MSESEKEYMEEAKNLVEVGEIKSHVQTVGLSGLGGAVVMQEKIKQYDEVRNVILDYIEDNLQPEIDFGQTDDRSDKQTLKKPGAEKVCRLFNTSPRWIRDFDTWEMLGKPAGTVCFICQIVDNVTGKVIGEGRGAEKVGNKGRDANKTIKNAEKCSLVDAALYTFMLSERFTQDGGGAKVQAIAEVKRALIADVGVLRTNIESKLSDLQWLQLVLKQIVHKSRIDTIGEHAEVRKAIFENDLFDLSTGAKI